LLSASHFIRDVVKEKKELQEKFDVHSRAKLVFSDTVVQNLRLTLNRQIGPVFQGLQNPSYKYESNIGKGKESTEYRLSLATIGNFVYYIYFDKFYLK
jgi:hypothetical protein